jgi:anti-sigma factor RsiW
MKTDDIQLMAYVDGHASPEERQAIEAEVRSSIRIATRVARLRASRLPYREAFAYQKLPPVPRRLLEKIAELVRAALEARANPARANALGAGTAGESQDAGRTRPRSNRIGRGPIRLKW